MDYMSFQVSEMRSEAILNNELYSKYMQIRLNDAPMQRISKFYLSPDEEDMDEETREKAGDDVEVLGKWNYSRPYVPDFRTFEPTKIYRKNDQVETMVWSPDGSQIMHVVHQIPEVNSPFLF
jgi:hypothetical protein